MTLDDLHKTFREARGRGNLTRKEGDLKGLRAVVEALRDELPLRTHSCHFCDRASATFNEILASDGVEKAAGGPTSNDGRLGGLEHPSVHSSPAADEYTMCRACGHPYIATTKPPGELP